MRRFIAISFAASILAPAVAVAEVSADLVFCSKLANPRERIACYDAAARIAAHGAPATPVVRAAPAPMMTRDAANRPAPVAEYATRNRFDGGYAAIGGSFGATSSRQLALTGLGGSMNDTVSASGWSGTAALGYNTTIGRFLMGIELSGRYGDEAASATGINTFPLTPFSFLAGAQTITYDIRSDASAHIAARFGVTIDETLLFATVGVGAMHVIERVSLDQRQLLQCAVFFFNGCVSFNPVGGLTTASVSRWLPSMTFGVGMEQNWGQFFARAQGEIEVAALQSTRFSTMGNATSDQYWTARAMAVIGIRF